MTASQSETPLMDAWLTSASADAHAPAAGSGRSDIVCGVGSALADVAAIASAWLLVGPALGLFGAPALQSAQVVSALEASLWVVCPAIGVLFYFQAHGHYRERIPFWTQLREIAVASGVAMLMSGFIELTLPTDSSWLMPLAIWVAFPILAVVIRSAVRDALSRAGLWQRAVVIIGEAPCIDAARNVLLSESGLGYTVAASIDVARLRQGTKPNWRALLRASGAGLLVVAVEKQGTDERALIEDLTRARVPFAVMPQLGGLPLMGCDRTCFFRHDTIMLSYRSTLAQPLTRLLKATIDLLIASLALLIVAPVMIVIAVLVRRDGGPALYAHTRIGAGGRAFKCLKFRSMVLDSDRVLQEVLARDPDAAAEWDAVHKLQHDPRITPIGRMLRQTSLDELPQLFNVLRLEMSLVGPRPIIRREIPRYAENIAYYYGTRPGITGLWQVSGRSATSYKERVQFDTAYVKNWTLWHDLAILLRTVPVLVKRRGAW